jgi:SAM-dependent methyltransferase
MFFRDLAPMKRLDERLRELRGLELKPHRQQERRALLTTLLEAVSEPALEAIRQRDAALIAQDTPQGWFKYLDCCYFIDHNLDVVQNLGLIDARPATILDIGAGAGHFAFVCSRFGHSVTPIDVETPLLGEIAAAMGVRRLIARVEPNQPLPDFQRKFDLICAESTMFNLLNWTWRGPIEQTRDPSARCDYWTLAHWRFLFADLMENHLRYPGRLYFNLNCEIHHGVHERNTELLNYCADHGANSYHKGGGIIDWHLSEPIRFAEIEPPPDGAEQ